MTKPKFSNSIAIVVGSASGRFYYSHKRLDVLFAGAIHITLDN